MATGEQVWAQGWSEPNAGSDMAAMLVRGEDKHQNFRLCNPPTGIMKEKDILFWSEISEVRNAIMMDS